jgi:site-specific DNA-methyltransferase (adenine-specific)
LRKYSSSLFAPEIEFKEQHTENVNWDEEIKKLPYVFKDPIKLNAKIDPQKLKFGSKISVDDVKGADKSEYFSVKEIVTPNLIRLNSGILVRLIGVKPIPERVSDAMQFLDKKIGKGKIYFKFDKQKHDSKNRLLAYVYMKNKTFINAHLIKNGFADIDEEIPFRMKNKFHKLLQERKLHEK